MMLDPELIQHLSELTAQRDRHHLISATIQAINKLTGAKESTFFDVHKVRHTDPKSGLVAQKILLVEPLDPTGKEHAVGTFPDIMNCLNRRSHTTFPPDNKQPLTRSVFPIIVDQEVRSIFFHKTDHYGQEEKDILSFALKIFVNMEELLKTKDQDPLTGLLNRRSFDETISTVLDQCNHNPKGERMPAQGACLAIFDIDHFKKVNDVFGHAIGDEVLILFARLMEQVFRHNDRIYRFGGEEFLTLLVDADEEKANAALERFRESLENYKFPQVDQVTVSIGYVMVNESDYPPVLLEKSDKALYFAKNNGRNQVCSFEALVANGNIANIEHAADDIELWD
ncbi:MAG: GGDEF domain-containing protein [Magnetococcales bacterium]|nr:GGDEF domain-containing protein [Magnetococcales bacterium]